jgi:flagellar protein FliO/FliZ
MFLAVLQTLFGLVVTLGLVGLAAYAARRWGPVGMMQIRTGRVRRMDVIESLALDPSRRLVLIRLDQEERLLLLGEGRMLDHKGAYNPPPPSAAAGDPLAAFRPRAPRA